MTTEAAASTPALSPTVGVSDLTAGQTPAAIPQDPIAARSQIEALKSDRAFYDKLMAKDETATKTWRELHAAAYPPQNIASIEDVAGQAAQREIEMRETTLSTLRRVGNLTDTQVAEIRDRRPCSPEEHEFAVEEVARMKADEAFRRRYVAGDRQARNEFTRMVQLAALPVRR